MIKRYDPIKGADYSSMSPVGEMKESLYGGYVKYEDHLKANEWISVEDRLPDEGTKCLVWVVEPVEPCEYMDFDLFEEGVWYNIEEHEQHAACVALPPGASIAMPKVTHWQNLPTPPTSKEESTND